MTTTLATAEVTSTASPAAFFARWADMATWPSWNLDTEWVRLDGAFTQGATGVLKPKGGPKVRFVVETLVPGLEFNDVSQLLGARLGFRHLVTAMTGGGCTVRVTVTMGGPLAAVWKLILGKGLIASLQPDLDRLARVAEADETAAANTRGADTDADR
jgi:hypothetical protein